MLDKTKPENNDDHMQKEVESGIQLPNASLDDDPIPEMMPTPPEQQKKGLGSHIFKFTRAIFQFVLMVAVLFGAYTLMDRLVSSKEEPQKRPSRQATFTVDTLTTTRADHRPTVLVYGQIQTARNVDLRSLVGGEIVEVNPNLSSGARVIKGDLLIAVDAFNFEGAVLEAKANLRQVEAGIREIDARLASELEQLNSAQEQLDLARADLKRAQSLAASGTLTNKQVDDRTLIVSQRAQSVSQRRNNIVIAEAQKEQQIANSERLKWKISEAERKLENTALYAPFSGIVSNANAEPGRSVSTNDVIASIYDEDALEARFTLTNAQYGRMAVDTDPLIGRKVEITWTIGATEYTYSGSVDRIGATVAADRGGVEVVAVIDPADHAVQIRPGAFVEITVPDRAYMNAIKVPETSIYEQSHIFIVNEGQLFQRDIKILAFDGSDAIIATVQGSAEIANGDKVMTTRLTEASEGIRVRPPGQSERPNRNGEKDAGAELNGKDQSNGKKPERAQGDKNKRPNPNRPRAVNRGLGG